MIRRVLSIASGLVVITAAIVVGAGLFIFFLRMKGPTAPDAYHAYSQVEFVTIILTAVTVVLTALAIVLALAGAIGYVTIKDAATRGAEAEGRRVAAEVAKEVASEVAARTAEEITTQTSGRDVQAGEQFARAQGGFDVSDDYRE